MLPAEYRLNRDFGVEHLFKHNECTGQTGNLYVRYGVKQGQRGWYYVCHSCQGTPDGLAGFHVEAGGLAPSETMRQMKELMVGPSQAIVQPKMLELPEDTNGCLPPQAMAYLLKYGITPDERQLLRFSWSETLDRMIMPVYSYEGDLLYWQARNLGEVTPDRPKYKNIYMAGSRNVFAKFDSRDNKFPDTVVLVEAIISAVKLSRYVDTIALLGSYIPSSILPLLKQYKRVVLWLDPDKAIAQQKIGIRLSGLTGIPIYATFTNKKPKEYNSKEIIEWLS